MSDDDKTPKNPYGDESNPEWFSADADAIRPMGRLGRTVNHLSIEEQAEAAEHDAAIQAARDAAMKDD